MLMSFESSTVLLSRNKPITLRKARGTLIECTEGSLWLTIEGQANDILLRCGQNQRIASNGLVVIEALPAGAVRLTRGARVVSGAALRLFFPPARRAAWA